MKSKIQDDIKTAMRSRDKETLIVLRGLMAAIKQIEIDTRKDLDEKQIISVLQKEIKKRKDAIEFAQKAGRQELIEQDEKEIVVLQNYLGEQLSDDKLKEVIIELVKDGAGNIGQIMQSLKGNYAGKFEGKTASMLAKQILNN